MNNLYHLLPTWLHLTLEAIGAFWLILAVALVVLILIYARKVSGEDDGAGRDAMPADGEPWTECPDCLFFFHQDGHIASRRPQQFVIPFSRCNKCQAKHEHRTPKSISRKLEASFKGE